MNGCVDAQILEYTRFGTNGKIKKAIQADRCYID